MLWEGVMIQFSSMIKGQVTQSLLTSMLVNAGYRVSRLGVEEQLPEINYMDWQTYDRLALPRELRSLPDLLVATLDVSKAFLVEVKFRREFTRPQLAGLLKQIEPQMAAWPGTVVVLFIAEPVGEPRGFVQDHVRCIRAADLKMLASDEISLPRKWASLPMLHGVFDDLRHSEYMSAADGITEMLEAMLALDEQSF